MLKPNDIFRWMISSNKVTNDMVFVCKGWHLVLHSDGSPGCPEKYLNHRRKNNADYFSVFSIFFRPFIWYYAVESRCPQRHLEEMTIKPPRPAGLPDHILPEPGTAPLPAMTGQETESLSVRYHLSNGGEQMTKKDTSGQGGYAFREAIRNNSGRILIIVLAIAAIVIGVVIWNKVDPNSMPIWLQQMIDPLRTQGPAASEIPPVPPVPDI